MPERAAAVSRSRDEAREALEEPERGERPDRIARGQQREAFGGGREIDASQIALQRRVFVRC